MRYGPLFCRCFVAVLQGSFSKIRGSLQGNTECPSEIRGVLELAVYITWVLSVGVIMKVNVACYLPVWSASDAMRVLRKSPTIWGPY